MSGFVVMIAWYVRASVFLCITGLPKDSIDFPLGLFPPPMFIGAHPLRGGFTR